MKNKLYKLQQLKYITIGILIGMLIIAPVVCFADTIINAWISDDIRIYFNGEHKDLPQDYDIITYNGRTYTPTRFIAEELGANVEWDEDTKSINITYDEGNKEEHSKEQDDGISEKKYNKLPLKDISLDVYIFVTNIILEDDITWVYLELEGRSDTPIQLRQSTTKIETENMTYLQTDVDYERIIDPIDVRWYNDIRKEIKTSGYSKMPPLPKDTKKITLYLETIKNDGSNEITEFEFDIKL